MFSLNQKVSLIYSKLGQMYLIKLTLTPPLPSDFESILATVYFLMQKNPKVQFWSTYQVRSADWSLEGLLYKWDMRCVHIPLESFDADKEDIAESTLPGRHTIEMLIISLAKDSS